LNGAGTPLQCRRISTLPGGAAGCNRTRYRPTAVSADTVTAGNAPPWSIIQGALPCRGFGFRIAGTAAMRFGIERYESTFNGGNTCMSKTLFTWLAAILMALSLAACEQKQSDDQGTMDQGTGDQTEPATPPGQ
jgi:hypothetical protein